eukprot:TRINITY_DN2764_c0_g1_i2.p1 TRINITY_DN2764_c0_g1~~TRINITY_DN2764_c0_g1_i2.p1  ORF type:complete len:161 (-),score=32.03 TRINITY_DN2764_c0_g1_i2:235-717(-)
MKIILVAILIVAFLGLVSAKNMPMTYEICSPPSAPTHLERATIIPNPMVVGQNTTATLYGDLHTTVDTGAYFTMKIYYQGFKVSQKKESMCKDATVELPFHLGHLYIHGLKCPQAPGKIVLAETASLEVKPLLGKYNLKLEVYNGDGTYLACAKLDLKAQ